MQIPVEYEVAPLVQTIPSVISLGTVVLGESREAKVQLVSRTGKPVDVQVESQPKECLIELDREKNPPEIVVQVTLEEPGIWQGVIKGKLRVSSLRAEPFEIKCTAYGQTSSAG